MVRSKNIYQLASVRTFLRQSLIFFAKIRIVSVDTILNIKILLFFSFLINDIGYYHRAYIITVSFVYMSEIFNNFYYLCKVK